MWGMTNRTVGGEINSGEDAMSGLGLCVICLEGERKNGRGKPPREEKKTGGEKTTTKSRQIKHRCTPTKSSQIKHRCTPTKSRQIKHRCTFWVHY